MISNSTKSMILKAYALSISGIEAEKHTATKLLADLLKTHQITLEDIVRDEKQIVGRFYTYNHTYELDLMVQLLEAKFYERNSYHIAESQSVVNISLSETNHEIFDFLFGVYLRAFERELKQCSKTDDFAAIFIAFLNRYGLFPNVAQERKNRAQNAKVVNIYAATPTERKK